MASSKVKTYFWSPPLPLGGGGLGSSHCNNNLPQPWCCESTRQLACPLFFPERASLCSSTRCRADAASSPDTTLARERNAPDPGPVNFFAHAGPRSVWHRNSRASQRRLSVPSLDPFIEMFGRETPSLSCVSPISTVGSCKAKSSGAFIFSVPSKEYRSEGAMHSAPSHQLQCVGGWEEKKGYAPVSFGTY